MMWLIVFCADAPGNCGQKEDLKPGSGCGHQQRYVAHRCSSIGCVSLLCFQGRWALPEPPFCSFVSPHFLSSFLYSPFSFHPEILNTGRTGMIIWTTGELLNSKGFLDSWPARWGQQLQTGSRDGEEDGERDRSWGLRGETLTQNWSVLCALFPARRKIRKFNSMLMN